MKKISLLLALIISFSLVAVGCGKSPNGEVYVYSYGDYFDPKIADQFKEETGINVIIDTYDTAEEMYTVMEKGATNYDCICTSDYMIEKMIHNDLLDELNYDNIPNIKNIEDMYMTKSKAFDPKNKYSVPYMVGTAGIIYDPELVGNIEIDSWENLWDEKFKDQIVMPDSVREAFMIGLKKQGYSLNSNDESEIKSSAKELMKQKKLVYKYANDSARDMLADGSAAIGVVWNGEYLYTKELNDNVKFVIPKEGTEFFIDSWIISKDATNKENAEKWIDFLCRGDIAAQNFEYLNYTTPNKEAKKLIDKELLKDEAVFPTQVTLKNCESLRMLDEKTSDLYSKYWKQVKSQ